MAPRANNPNGTIAFSNFGLRHSALPTTVKNFSAERHLRAFVIESVTLGYVLVLSQARAHFGALTSIITHSLTDYFDAGVACRDI